MKKSFLFCSGHHVKSVGFEEPVVGAAAADFELDALEALRTTAFVSRTGFVDVNANVHAATVELDTDKLAFSGVGGGGGIGHRIIWHIAFCTV